jgi:hypothetical protein
MALDERSILNPINYCTLDSATNCFKSTSLQNVNVFNDSLCAVPITLVVENSIPVSSFGNVGFPKYEIDMLFKNYIESQSFETELGLLQAHSVHILNKKRSQC